MVGSAVLEAERVLRRQGPLLEALGELLRPRQHPLPSPSAPRQVSWGGSSLHSPPSGSSASSVNERWDTNSFQPPHSMELRSGGAGLVTSRSGAQAARPGAVTAATSSILLGSAPRYAPTLAEPVFRHGRDSPSQYDDASTSCGGGTSRPGSACSRESRPQRIQWGFPEDVGLDIEGSQLDLSLEELGDLMDEAEDDFAVTSQSDSFPGSRATSVEVSERECTRGTHRLREMSPTRIGGRSQGLGGERSLGVNHEQVQDVDVHSPAGLRAQLTLSQAEAIAESERKAGAEEEEEEEAHMRVEMEAKARAEADAERARAEAEAEEDAKVRAEAAAEAVRALAEAEAETAAEDARLQAEAEAAARAEAAVKAEAETRAAAEARERKRAAAAVIAARAQQLRRSLEKTMKRKQDLEHERSLLVARVDAASLERQRCDGEIAAVAEVLLEALPPQGAGAGPARAPCDDQASARSSGSGSAARLLVSALWARLDMLHSSLAAAPGGTVEETRNEVEARLCEAEAARAAAERLREAASAAVQAAATLEEEVRRLVDWLEGPPAPPLDMEWAAAFSLRPPHAWALPTSSPSRSAIRNAWNPEPSGKTAVLAAIATGTSSEASLEAPSGNPTRPAFAVAASGDFSFEAPSRCRAVSCSTRSAQALGASLEAPSGGQPSFWAAASVASRSAHEAHKEAASPSLAAQLRMLEGERVALRSLQQQWRGAVSATRGTAPPGPPCDQPSPLLLPAAAVASRGGMRLSGHLLGRV